MVVMAPMAVASMDANAGFGRADMRAGAYAVRTDTAARAHRTDMGPGMHAVPAHTGTNADHRAGMTAGIDAVIADTGASADRADMGPGADTMLADMRAHANAQHFHTPADIGKSSGRRQKGERE